MCQSIPTHPHHKDTQLDVFMVEMPGFEPGSCSPFDLLQRYKYIYILVLGVCQPDLVIIPEYELIRYQLQQAYRYAHQVDIQ